MSNNYNDGYRIAAMPLPELFSFFERARGLMTAGIREYMAKRLITDAVAIVDFFTASGGCLSDIRFFGDDYEPDDAPLMSVYYEVVAELTGSSNPRYINKKIRPLLYSFHNMKMRPPIKDYSLFKVIFAPYGEHVYCVPDTKISLLKDLWQSCPGIEFYPYSGSADKPESITPEEWNARAANWMAAMYKRRCGSVILADATDIPAPAEISAQLDDVIPSIDERAEKLALMHILKEEISAAKEAGRLVHEWSEEYYAELSLIHNRIDSVDVLKKKRADYADSVRKRLLSIPDSQLVSKTFREIGEEVGIRLAAPAERKGSRTGR